MKSTEISNEFKTFQFITSNLSGLVLFLITHGKLRKKHSEGFR